VLLMIKPENISEVYKNPKRPKGDRSNPCNVRSPIPRRKGSSYDSDLALWVLTPSAARASDIPSTWRTRCTMRLSVAGEAVEVGYTGGVGVDDMMWVEMFGVVVVVVCWFLE